MQALAATFAPNVELPSPLLGSFRFRGREDVLGILSAVYALLGKTTWEAPVGTGTQRLAIAHSTVLGIHIDDAMVFELNDEGYISVVRPHLRPRLATLVFMLALGPRVATKPGMVLRAVRPAR
jgi:hypothetical protein